MMARRLSDAAPRSSFADSAERFADLARSVKAQQIAEHQGVSTMPTAGDLEPPDESWARRHASKAIGPSGAQAVTAMSPVPHRHDFAPDFASLRPALTAKSGFSRKAKITASAPQRGAPMDIRFGHKEERPRRSWLGRLFRGSA